MLRSVRPYICLSPDPSSTILVLWLLQNTNRKPHTGSQTHWLVWLYCTTARSVWNCIVGVASKSFTRWLTHRYTPGSYHFAAQYLVVVVFIDATGDDKQVALLWQRDRATRLSVEILQLQNIAIVWHYLRDPTFSRFYTILKCDRHRQTDGQIHDDGMYCA